MLVMPPRLETERLWMRPPEAADVDAIFAYAGDPAVARFMIWPVAQDRGDTEIFLEDVAAGWDAGDDYCWVVIERAAARVIGAVSCQFDAHGAELGYILARDRWGRGLASEAARSVFAAAKRLDEVYRVWATCDVDNTASARVLEKIGLTFEARLARWSPCPNMRPNRGPRDVFVYAWTR